MRTLSQLERAFQDHVLHGQPAIAQEIVSDTLDAATRLDIYAQAYRLRLIEALETDFVALRAYLGNDRFDTVAHAYIAQCPSRHPSLRYFGAALSGFLRDPSPYAAEPLLAELAAFDWALTDAFDAPDSTPITVEAIAAVPPAAWPGLCFTLHPSLLRLDLHWNAPAIWNAVDAVEALPAPTRSEFPISWLIWRQDLHTYFRSLGVDEAFALETVRAGGSFADMCEGLCEWVDAQHVAPHAAGLLKQWVVDGLICAVATN